MDKDKRNNLEAMFFAYEFINNIELGQFEAQMEDESFTPDIEVIADVLEIERAIYAEVNKE